MAGVEALVALEEEVQVEAGNPWATLQTQVEARLIEIESRTLAEVVPLIVARSSTIRHVFPMLFLLIWLALELSGLPWEIAFPFVSLLLAWGGARVQWVQRFFVPPQDQLEQVLRRAEFEWLEEGIKKTEARSGVLLFISLLERRVVILADRAVQEKLGTENPWEAVCSETLQVIQKQGVDAGVLRGLGLLGAVLERVLPRTPTDAPPPNALKNQLIIKN